MRIAELKNIPLLSCFVVDITNTPVYENTGAKEEVFVLANNGGTARVDMENVVTLPFLPEGGARLSHDLVKTIERFMAEIFAQTNIKNNLTRKAIHYCSYETLGEAKRNGIEAIPLIGMTPGVLAAFKEPEHCGVLAIYEERGVVTRFGAFVKPSSFVLSYL